LAAKGKALGVAPQIAVRADMAVATLGLPMGFVASGLGEKKNKTKRLFCDDVPFMQGSL
jgi:hypothetical protein